MKKIVIVAILQFLSLLPNAHSYPGEDCEQWRGRECRQEAAAAQEAQDVIERAAQAAAARDHAVWLGLIQTALKSNNLIEHDTAISWVTDSLSYYGGTFSFWLGRTTASCTVAFTRNSRGSVQSLNMYSGCTLPIDLQVQLQINNPTAAPLNPSQQVSLAAQALGIDAQNVDIINDGFEGERVVFNFWNYPVSCAKQMVAGITFADVTINSCHINKNFALEIPLQ